MDLEAVERRMRPGGWNTKPMLRSGDALAAVLETDASRLAELRVSHERLGARLGEILAVAGATDWFRPARHGDIDVEIRRRRGFITCPWAAEEVGKCLTGRGSRPTANEFLLHHRTLRLSLRGFEISAHLIRDHGFFGGPGTAFRIEPRALAELLNVEPGG